MGRRKKKGENDSQATPRDDASISGEDQKQILQSALEKLSDSFIRIPPMPSLGISEKDSLLQSFSLNAQKFADNNPLDENESEAMRKGFGALDLSALLKDVDADNERMALDLVAKGFLDPRKNGDNWRIIALQVGCSPDAFREDIYEAAVAYRLRLDDTKSLNRDDSSVDPQSREPSDKISGLPTRESEEERVHALLKGQRAKLFYFLMQRRNFVTFDTLRETFDSTDSNARIFSRADVTDEAITKAIKRLKDDLLDTRFECQIDGSRVKLGYLE